MSVWFDSTGAAIVEVMEKAMARQRMQWRLVLQQAAVDLEVQDE